MPKKNRRAAGLLATYLICIGLAILSARAVGAYIDWRIASFNPGEFWWMNFKVPPEYGYLITELNRDTGRSMVFISAPTLTPLVMIFAYGLVCLRRMIRKRLQG